MLKAIIAFYDSMNTAVSRGVTVRQITGMPVKEEIGRMKEIADVQRIRSLIGEVDTKMAALEVEK
jgi:vacuolar-type H+-ATPase catalytic subunit A/Vma1